MSDKIVQDAYMEKLDLINSHNKSLVEGRKNYSKDRINKNIENNDRVKLRNGSTKESCKAAEEAVRRDSIAELLYNKVKNWRQQDCSTIDTDVEIIKEIRKTDVKGKLVEENILSIEEKSIRDTVEEIKNELTNIVEKGRYSIQSDSEEFYSIHNSFMRGERERNEGNRDDSRIIVGNSEKSNLIGGKSLLASSDREGISKARERIKDEVDTAETVVRTQNTVNNCKRKKLKRKLDIDIQCIADNSVTGKNTVSTCENTIKNAASEVRKTITENSC